MWIATTIGKLLEIRYDITRKFKMWIKAIFEIVTNENPWNPHSIFFFNFQGKRVNVKIWKVGFMLFYYNTSTKDASTAFNAFCLCWININVITSPIWCYYVKYIMDSNKNLVFEERGLKCKKKLEHSNLFLSCWYALMYNHKTFCNLKMEYKRKYKVIHDSLQHFYEKK